MNLWDAIILGLVEGLTEFLPVSSTGHLILVAHWLGLDDAPAERHAVNAFNIIIQGGAILAVLGLFWPRVVQMLRGLLGRDAAGRRLMSNLFLSFLPAAVLGVLLNDWIEERLFRPAPVTLALFLGGVALILLRSWQRRLYHDTEPGGTKPDAHAYVDLDHLTWRRALLIGVLQCLAMWPGTSRSMMTIIGGMLVGMRPRHAAEYSFLLGVPTLGGACAYKAYRTFFVDEHSIVEVLGVAEVLLGAFVAALSAAVAVKWMIGYLNRHGLALFGWYRIALAGVLAALILDGRLTIAPTPQAPSEVATTPGRSTHVVAVTRAAASRCCDTRHR